MLVGAVLPATPLAATLGFAPLPGGFFAALVLMVVAYLALVELGKRWFYRPAAPPRAGGPTDLGTRNVRRRAARFSVAARPPLPLRPGRRRGPPPPAANDAGRA